jgi:hypothetical protein
MASPWSRTDVRQEFQNCLHAAITRGRAPLKKSRLGVLTAAAIARIAQLHPEAPVALIADAFDVFGREHLEPHQVWTEGRVFALQPLRPVRPFRPGRHSHVLLGP